MSQNSRSANDNNRDRLADGKLNGRAYRQAKHSVLEKERQKENKYKHKHKVVTQTDDDEDDFDMFPRLDEDSAD